MALAQSEKACNDAIRRAARKGNFVVVEQRVHDAQTGKFVGGSNMNELIRQRVGRVRSEADNGTTGNESADNANSGT